MLSTKQLKTHIEDQEAIYQDFFKEYKKAGNSHEQTMYKSGHLGW